jgi:fibronectin type 3 domain-containing protein
LSTNQTATLTVQFDPTAAGAATGTLTIISTSTSNPTDVISLTGTGVATAYEVSLNWDAPSSSPAPVTGYNVYRSPSGGTSYQQVNTSTLTQTSYVDTSVQDGQTYDYIVESVDAAGNSSAPSNMASVAIP